MYKVQYIKKFYSNQTTTLKKRSIKNRHKLKTSILDPLEKNLSLETNEKPVTQHRGKETPDSLYNLGRVISMRRRAAVAAAASSFLLNNVRRCGGPQQGAGGGLREEKYRGRDARHYLLLSRLAFGLICVLDFTKIWSCQDHRISLILNAVSIKKNNNNKIQLEKKTTCKLSNFFFFNIFDYQKLFVSNWSVSNELPRTFVLAGFEPVIILRQLD